MIPTRIIGYQHIIDNSFKDYKLILVFNYDPKYDNINNLKDLSLFTQNKIKDFS